MTFYSDSYNLCSQCGFSLFKILAIDMEGHCGDTEINRYHISDFFVVCLQNPWELSFVVVIVVVVLFRLFVCFVLCYLLLSPRNWHAKHTRYPCLMVPF